MASTRPLPRHTLAKNLRLLLDRTGMSGPEVAQKAGVDRKTINNQLNGRYDPRPEQVQAVAEVFGFNSWQLLDPGFNPAVVNGKLKELIANYTQADAQGQENILRVAEMAANYSPKK